MVLDNRKRGAGAVYLYSTVRGVVQEKGSGLSLYLELSGICSVKQAGKVEKSSLGKKYLKKIFRTPSQTSFQRIRQCFPSLFSVLLWLL